MIAGLCLESVWCGLAVAVCAGCGFVATSSHREEVGGLPHQGTGTIHT